MARPPLPPVSAHDRMLAAAKGLFAEHGYENTSTVAIARAAGTSESQLMKHFGSKEGLLEAIFDQGWRKINQGLHEIVSVAAKPAARLEALVGVMVTALEKDTELRQLMLLEGRRIRKEGHMIMLTRGFREFVEALDAVLREMRAAGQLRPGLHLQAARSALMGAFEGLLRDQLLARRVGYPAHYSAKEARQVFNAVLASLTAARPRRRR